MEKVKERTSSSILGLHFGHYKSAAESKITTKLHTIFLDTMITTGSVVLMEKNIIGYVREKQRKYQCWEIKRNTTDWSRLQFLKQVTSRGKTDEIGGTKKWVFKRIRR